jgi:hypothetical protein
VPPKKKKTGGRALEKEIEALKKAIEKLGAAETPSEAELLGAVQAIMPLPLYEDHDDAFFELLSEVIDPFKHHGGGISFQLPWDTPVVDPPQPGDPAWRKRMAANIRRLAAMGQKLAKE